MYNQTDIKMETLELLKITRDEMESMLSDYGHHMNVTIPVTEKVLDPDHFETKWITVLNNGVVYNPYGKWQGTICNNKECAKRAMKYIKDEVNIYSSIFHNITGHYELID